jgi:hypothetical protein
MRDVFYIDSYNVYVYDTRIEVHDPELGMLFYSTFKDSIWFELFASVNPPCYTVEDVYDRVLTCLHEKQVSMQLVQINDSEQELHVYFHVLVENPSWKELISHVFHT